MKKWAYILLLLPCLAFGQFDFETRFTSIDATTLPAIEDISNISFYKTSNIFSTKLRTFQMNAGNYRQPVDMMTALEGQQQFIDRKIEVTPEIKSRTFGFSVSVNGSNSFNNSTTSGGIRNRVYQAQRSGPVFYCPRSGLNVLSYQ